MDGHSSAAALPIAGMESREERLGSLFDAHHERLYRLARRMTRNVDDALDLVQETFVRAARVPHAIPYGAAPEEAWLVRVLVNVQRDAWRLAPGRRAPKVRAEACRTWGGRGASRSRAHRQVGRLACARVAAAATTSSGDPA